MSLARKIAIVLALLSAPAFSMDEEFELRARTAYCNDDLVSFIHDIYAGKGAGVPMANYMAIYAKIDTKDKLTLDWLDVQKKIIVAVYADNAPAVRALNEPYFAACMAYNYRQSHQPKKVTI